MKKKYKPVQKVEIPLLNELLDSISEDTKNKVNEQMEFIDDIRFAVESMTDSEWNHNLPLDSFKKQLEIIRLAGFKPIAVTQMYLEDTFVFETEEESKLAYEMLEVKDFTVDGWWYGKEEFLETVKEYESHEGASKVRVYWL